MENEIMNYENENEIMVEDVVADGGSGIGTGAAMLIGAGIAFAVTAGVKLAKKGINWIKSKKAESAQPTAEAHDFVDVPQEDIDVVTKGDPKKK